MESNWRLNVWRLGVGYAGIKLVARLLPESEYPWIPSPQWIAKVDAGTFVFAQILALAGDDFPPASYFDFLPTGNFPYGHEVISDH